MTVEAIILQGRDQPATACISIARMTLKRFTLYMRVPPPWGESILVGIYPFPIDDYVPQGYDIEWEIWCL